MQLSFEAFLNIIVILTKHKPTKNAKKKTLQKWLLKNFQEISKIAIFYFAHRYETICRYSISLSLAAVCLQISFHSGLTKMNFCHIMVQTTPPNHYRSGVMTLLDWSTSLSGFAIVLHQYLIIFQVYFFFRAKNLICEPNSTVSVFWKLFQQYFSIEEAAVLLV